MSEGRSGLTLADL